jgi:hypothetical protein
MPAFGAVQTPTTLSSGEKIAVLNAENLANNALTMAIALTPQPLIAVLAIVNQSSQTVSLVGSADGVNFYPVTDDEGVAVTASTNTVVVATVSNGLFYAIKAGGAITAGTIWLAR